MACSLCKDRYTVRNCRNANCPRDPRNARSSSWGDAQDAAITSNAWYDSSPSRSSDSCSSSSSSSSDSSSGCD